MGSVLGDTVKWVDTIEWVMPLGTLLNGQCPRGHY